MHSLCHFLATLGASAAGFDTVLHVAKLLAILRAGLADFAAYFANSMVESRSANHEIGRGLADFSAVEHQPEMVGLDMLSTQLKAMVQGGVQTDLMAMAARLDAGFHRKFCGGMGFVMHGEYPVVFKNQCGLAMGK